MSDVTGTESLLVLADGNNSIFDWQIFSGENQVDAGMGRSPRGIDAGDSRVRMRRAQQFAVRHARKCDVVGETSLAGDFGARVHAAAGDADYAQIFRVFLRRNNRRI